MCFPSCCCCYWESLLPDECRHIPVPPPPWCWKGKRRWLASGIQKAYRSDPHRRIGSIALGFRGSDIAAGWIATSPTPSRTRCALWSCFLLYWWPDGSTMIYCFAPRRHIVVDDRRSFHSLIPSAFSFFLLFSRPVCFFLLFREIPGTTNGWQLHNSFVIRFHLFIWISCRIDCRWISRAFDGRDSHFWWNLPLKRGL